MNILGKCLNNRYRIVGKLGEGGMGVVFQARDVKLGRFVAVKVLNPDYSGPVALERLRREIEIQARIEHANVVRLYDAGCDPLNYFVMEYVEGTALATLQSEQRLPEQLHAVAQAAAGLARAHAHGIVHRDLKPQNILVSVYGEAKVSDFGLSRVLDTVARVTRENSTLGSAHYMAPEQCHGANVDQRADLYALGVILYQCATRRLPFIGRRTELFAQHLHGRVQPPHEIAPGTPEELEMLILRLLEKEPPKRPASAEAVRAELARLLRTHWPMIPGDEFQTSVGETVRRLTAARHADYDVFIPVVPSMVRDGSAKSPVPDTSSRVSVQCPQCNAILRLRREDSKKLIGCPLCRHRFRLAPLPKPTDEPRFHAVDSSEPLRVDSPARPKVDSPQRPAAESVSDPFGLDELPPQPTPLPRIGTRTNRRRRRLPTWAAAALGASGVMGVVVTVLIAALAVGGSKPTPNVDSPNSSVPPTVVAPPPLGLVPPVTHEPPAQQPGPVSTARLTVRTNVRGERLTVDETERPDGLAAGSLDLAPGKHTVTLNWGRQKLSKPIELVGGTVELALIFENAQIIDTCRRSVCLVRTRYGHGSGFLVEDQQTTTRNATKLPTWLPTGFSGSRSPVAPPISVSGWLWHP